jgi:spermidine synthase
MKRPTALLFFVIFIEGYVVLASELLAIRQLIPFVGSGTEIIAIIISAVLLPLAIGYHHGGRKRMYMRKLLIKNLLTAMVILAVGLSYIMLELFFAGLRQLGIQQAIAQAFLYGLIFLAYPIYLLGQTVPIVSNYFAHTGISALTGRMLFFSTVGSFLGSVFSTLILMNIIGVHMTVIITLGLLGVLVFVLSRKLICGETILASVVMLLIISANAPSTMRALNIVSNNAYNMVTLYEDNVKNTRRMMINRSNSSALSGDGKRIFPYITYIESIFIDPIKKAGNPPRDILVLGAGGFTIGLDDKVNRYQFVDIDPDLKAVSEKYLIRAPLSPNKTFTATSARAFVHRTKQQYDLILIDAYTNPLSMPMEITTREFLIDTKKLLKPNGVLLVNHIAHPDLQNSFSRRYNRTFASVFNVYTQHVIGTYDPWQSAADQSDLRNIIYTYFNRSASDDTTVYTDDLNTYSLDRHRSN